MEEARTLLAGILSASLQVKSKPKRHRAENILWAKECLVVAYIHVMLQYVVGREVRFIVLYTQTAFLVYLRVGFWQNGLFADFYSWPTKFFADLVANCFSSCCREKLPRKSILQANPRQDPPKLGRSVLLTGESFLLMVGLCCLRSIGLVFLTYAWNLVRSSLHTLEIGLVPFYGSPHPELGLVFYAYGPPLSGNWFWSVLLTVHPQ